MTLSEFKSWFEGFTEGMESIPTEKQWQRIVAKIKSIDDTPTVREVFIDRYWPKVYLEKYRNPWEKDWGYGPNIGIGMGIGSSTSFSSGSASGLSSHPEAFNLVSAFKALGQVDYREVQ